MTRQKFNLKRLPFSPNKNPLLNGVSLRTRNKRVSAGGVQEVVNPRTGEVHSAVIVEEEEVDETHFVKVFTAGIRAAFGLSLTGSSIPGNARGVSKPTDVRRFCRLDISTLL